MWKQACLVLLGVALAFWLLPHDDKLHTLKGKRVLVTGSSDGIGEQIAYHYARLGANVAVTSRRLEKLNRVVKECQSLSSSSDQKHFAISADMSKVNDTKKVVEEAIKTMGGLDILVLNHISKAPIQSFKGTTDDLEIFQLTIDVNFRSYVFLTSHALPQLLANEGSIVVVNSLIGKVPHPYLASYSASKHALNGFFASLRNQFRSMDQKISVTSCHLGMIGTGNSIAEMKAAGADGLFKYFPPASPNNTAFDIIAAGAKRLDEVYTPYMDTRPLAFLYGVWPTPAEYIIRWISRTSRG